jgi:hypothetical protein
LSGIDIEKLLRNFDGGGCVKNRKTAKERNSDNIIVQTGPKFQVPFGYSRWVFAEKSGWNISTAKGTDQRAKSSSPGNQGSRS